MFGSMRRMKREERNRIRVNVYNNISFDSNEEYYRLYSKELTKRLILQRTLRDAKDYVKDLSSISEAQRKTLLALLTE